MNLTTLGDLITHRETTAGQQAGRLREQIATLTAELGRVDSELAALATTRTTLRALAAAEFTADDPNFASTPYQQILEVLATAPAGMRAKGICLARCRALTETRRRHPREAQTHGQPPRSHRRRTRSVHFRPEKDVIFRTALSPIGVERATRHLPVGAGPPN
ncbi:hypothetical protein O7632_09935 [Solwaraspora sp. WMMD406]|nr:hypothetical protein [Solwaraspora sp. WMMD406]MDG4764421.1 hypothetical protein [Solwaraspora sp. WMMD406]